MRGRSVFRVLGLGAWLVSSACGGSKGGDDSDAGILADGEVPDGVSITDADTLADADADTPTDGGARSPCDLVVVVEGGLSFPATGARATEEGVAFWSVASSVNATGRPNVEATGWRRDGTLRLLGYLQPSAEALPASPTEEGLVDRMPDMSFYRFPPKCSTRSRSYPATRSGCGSRSRKVPRPSVRSCLLAHVRSSIAPRAPRSRPARRRRTSWQRS